MELVTLLAVGEPLVTDRVCGPEKASLNKNHIDIETLRQVIAISRSVE